MVPKRSLKIICDYHLEDPSLIPEVIKKEDGTEEIKTFCNFFVQRVCHDFGYEKFAGMLANSIHDHCLSNEEWFKTDTEGAFDAISKNHLVLAAITDYPHGHVAIGYRSNLLVFSGKWNGYTIQVASVGQKNGVFGANWVFQKPPDLFILKE